MEANITKQLKDTNGFPMQKVKTYEEQIQDCEFLFDIKKKPEPPLKISNISINNFVAKTPNYPQKNDWKNDFVAKEKKITPQIPSIAIRKEEPDRV